MGRFLEPRKLVIPAGCAQVQEERTMETPNEMRAKIVGKATGDADFRARLLSDPKAVIGQELGVTIPESLSIEVHEEGGATAHLVLPPSSRLSEGDLQAVAGGRTVATKWDSSGRAIEWQTYLDW